MSIQVDYSILNFLQSFLREAEEYLNHLKRLESTRLKKQFDYLKKNVKMNAKI